MAPSVIHPQLKDLGLDPQPPWKEPGRVVLPYNLRAGGRDRRIQPRAF